MSARATRRDLALAMWVGSQLAPCPVINNRAVRVEGVRARLAHDLGVDYSPAEIAAALRADGATVTSDGRIDRQFSSDYWSLRARGSFAALYGAAAHGGR
jgi:hypothetical protein